MGTPTITPCAINSKPFERISITDANGAGIPLPLCVFPPLGLCKLLSSCFLRLLLGFHLFYAYVYVGDGTVCVNYFPNLKCESCHVFRRQFADQLSAPCTVNIGHAQGLNIAPLWSTRTKMSFTTLSNVPFQLALYSFSYDLIALLRPLIIRPETFC